MKSIRDYISFLISIAIQVISDFFEKLELLLLQKIFYLLSILILLLGITQLLTKKRKGRSNPKVVEFMINTQKANKVIGLAEDPEKQSRKVIMTFNKIKKGGNKVMKHFKNLNKVQIISLSLTLALLIFGILAAFIPELAFIGEHTEAYLAGIGLVAIPGIFTKGKAIGESFKESNLKTEIRELNGSIKADTKKLAELDHRYAEVIGIANDVAELGGELTQEQHITYNTYLTQKKALEARIDENKLKLEGLINGEDIQAD